MVRAHSAAARVREVHPRIVRLVRDHPRSPPVRWLAEQAAAYLKAWYDENYWDFERNGEAWALRTFAAWADERPLEVWDVGANSGEWSLAAHAALPRARVTAFEIVPSTAEPLLALAEREPWLSAVVAGLSSQEGRVEVHVSRDHDTTSAISPRGWTEFFDDSPPVDGAVTTGDAHLARVGGTPPTLLKIDTEGHESAVLEGCAGLLGREDGPAMIQLEYGDTWVPARASLSVVQPWLESFGYAVGRLHPEHVAFKRYERGDDHFRMGNMIAVRDDALRAALTS